MTDRFEREVAAELEVEVTDPTTLEFQIAVAPHPNTEVSERLSFILDGKPIHAMEIFRVDGFSSPVQAYPSSSAVILDDRPADRKPHAHAVKFRRK